MDVGNVTMFPDRANTFGTYNGSLASCDGGAGRCMQYAIRYEFKEGSGFRVPGF